MAIVLMLVPASACDSRGTKSASDWALTSEADAPSQPGTGSPAVQEAGLLEEDQASQEARAKAYLEAALVEVADGAGGRFPGFASETYMPVTYIQIAALPKPVALADGGNPASTDRQLSVVLADGREVPVQSQIGWMLSIAFSGIGAIPTAEEDAPLPLQGLALWRAGGVHRVPTRILGGTKNMLLAEPDLPPGAVILNDANEALGVVTGRLEHLNATVVRRLPPYSSRRFLRPLPAPPAPPADSSAVQRMLSAHTIEVLHEGNLIGFGIDWFVTKAGDQAIVLPPVAVRACGDGSCRIRRGRGETVAVAPFRGLPSLLVIQSKELLSNGEVFPFEGCGGVQRFRGVLVGQGREAPSGFVSRRDTFSTTGSDLDLPRGLLPGPVVDAQTGRLIGMTDYGGHANEVPRLVCLGTLFREWEAWVAP